MTNAITWINRRTKEIRRKHPGKSYKAAQKMASADYRATRKAPAKKKKTSKKKARPRPRAKKKKASRSRRVSGDLYIKHEAGVGRVKLNHRLPIGRKEVKEQIGWLEAQKFGARTKTEKKKWSAKIADAKVIYNRLP